MEATANVEAVVLSAENGRNVPAKPQRRTGRNPRGVFQRNGKWWIRYFDAQGRLRREKAGTWEAAKKLVDKRRDEALKGRKLPETLRRATVTFPEIARDALEYSKTHKRTYASDLYRMERFLGWWRERAADSITPQEIERRFNEAVEQDGWKPATVNRTKALLSLTYRLAIENGKVPSNPARLVRARQTDNARVCWLSADEESRLRAAIAEKWSRHLPELEIALHTG